MKVLIAEDLKELNEIFKKEEVQEVTYTSHIVGKVRDKNGVEKWEVVDRWCVIVK